MAEVRARADKALALLRSDPAIAAECSFYNQAHFARVFRQRVGQTPTEYRRAGIMDEEI
ncbi:MAG: AraC family transcriptional regulator [Candidatus Sumerlaeota bacterium]|nr:AraC family transcriptional regulator [Candidatus Sumerlaeota bacterium]